MKITDVMIAYDELSHRVDKKVEILLSDSVDDQVRKMKAFIEEHIDSETVRASKGQDLARDLLLESFLKYKLLRR